MSRILAISDIHGHVEGVKILLEMAKYNPKSDKLFLLGDFIDRRPFTWSSIEYIIELTEKGAEAIVGNTDYFYRKKKNADKNKQSLLRSTIKFIESLPLYIEHENFLFVHAGIRPGIALHKQTLKDLTEIREPFWKTPYPFSKFVVFGHTPTEKMGAKPGEIWVGPGMLGIDTGAKHDYRLTLVNLTEHISYSISTNPKHLYKDLRISHFK
ncbi:metallophosphoesterase [Niallia endozanthoxylica]|uniref:Serine/threonine protein phosphatase n=1 Tax=Niallia endozanthoxylica TaxID=2036016 RepID=A0A5J5HJ61_9BACI|nr:metallophosphoesterase [Niallia endozanthoxylica]KAA9019534.1 serine/threonine protein phosphatase [Niallia endozanthoxylica]